MGALLDKEKAFVFASLLASYMFLRKQCRSDDKLCETIQKEGFLDEIRNRLSADTCFSDVPEQSALFNGAAGLISDLCKENRIGIESKFYALVSSFSDSLPETSKKTAWKTAGRAAHGDEKISDSEQILLTELENLLHTEPPKKPESFTDEINKAGTAIFPLASFLAENLKTILLIVILCGGLGGGLAFYYFSRGPTLTQIEATFKGYEKIDTLYTSFTVIPIYQLSYSTGTKKRIEDTVSFYTRGTDELGRNRITGYDMADYNISIGYKNVSALIGEYIGRECPGDLHSLPEPEILSIKADVYPPEGSATSSQDLHVTDENEGAIKMDLIRRMKDSGQWHLLVARGKMVLSAYISIYCDPGE